MLVNLTEVLRYAIDHHCAIGAFNTPNFECIRAVIRAAEEANVPVIISHAELHEDVAPLSAIGPVMVLAAKNAAVPVCVHLDHCENLEYMQKALELGFTGVMYDGSTLSYEENVSNTKKAVAMAHQYKAGIEAEIGQLASREGGTGENAGGPIYTDPVLAEKFVQETGIDALAPSFGTAHGLYHSMPILDLDRVGQIKEKVGLPLVMHGGSGVSSHDYRIAISKGICKINYFSYMSHEGVKSAKTLLDTNSVVFFHEIACTAENAMKEDVAKAIKVFCNL